MAPTVNAIDDVIRVGGRLAGGGSAAEPGGTARGGEAAIPDPTQGTTRRGARILEAIRRHAPITRTEIAEWTGLNPATVTHGVGELLRNGLVEEVGKRPVARGQPPIDLRIRPDTAFTMGVHLGHRVVNTVISDVDGTIVARDSTEVRPDEPGPTLQVVAEACRALASCLGDRSQRLLGAGLAAFGPIDPRGGTISPPIYGDAWQRWPARRALSEALGIPVYLDNNATAAAIGEHWYGAATSFDDFLHVFLGYGLGGGLFLRGRVHRGASVNAGEVGHMIVEGDGAPWYRGPAGSLESEASLLRLERDLGGPPPLSQNLAASDDPRIRAWFERAARRLAQVVASVDHLLDLEAVVFGGLLRQDTLEALVDGVRAHRRRLGIENRPHRAELVVGATGPFSAALGAAMLPMYDGYLPARSAGSGFERAVTAP